jgi:hypothetical protein
VAWKSVNWLVKFTLKYIRNVFITYWIYKNCSKWDPPCSTYNSQCGDTVLQINWHVYIFQYSYWYKRLFWVNWLLGHSVFWLKEHTLDGFHKILATVRKQKNFHLIHRDKIKQDAPTVFQEMMNLEYCNTWHIFTVHGSRYMCTEQHDKVLSLVSMNQGTLRNGSIPLSHIYILSFPYHAAGDSNNELLTMDTEYFTSEVHNM